jgi:hypothetical protein
MLITTDSLALADCIRSLSFGVIGRLPRLVPEPGTIFNGYAVPAGVSLRPRIHPLVSWAVSFLLTC